MMTKTKKIYCQFCLNYTQMLLVTSGEEIQQN